ncbi:MAG: cytochrome c maturation protein CcmE [Actinomycetota bacterium]
MTHRRFVLIGAVGVVALVVTLMITSLSSGLTYYLYPSEAVAQQADFPDGTHFRLAGTVVEGSIREDGHVTSFAISDGIAQVSVDLEGRVPPMFQEGAPVLVEGAWNQDRFRGEEAVIRHDENYSIPEEGGGFEQ